MADKNQLIAQISQELLEELTLHGTRDLRQVRLSQMEDEVYQLADRISARLLCGMLEDQAGQVTDDDHCPHCHSLLEDHPPDDTPMQLKRCRVQWPKPVKRCVKCRRDFFPSEPGIGLSRGSDV